LEWEKYHALKEREMDNAKQNIQTLIMGGLTLFAVYLYHLSASPLPTKIEFKKIPLIKVNKEEKQAFNYLNRLREGAGLVPFKSQKQLKLAAKSHANYLTNHLTYGHREEAKYSDFTGEYGASRVRYHGYPAPQVLENVSANNRNYKESIDGLFSAIYHRLAFLDFRVNTIGIGISQNLQHRESTAFVYDMSSSMLEKLYKTKTKFTNKELQKALQSNGKNHSVVVYPYAKQHNVPPAFFNEIPDPLPDYDVSGFPVSISFNPSFYKSVKLLTFKIFTQNGTEVENVTLYTNETDPHKKFGKFDFVLFPLERLKWNQQYHVKFRAMVDNKIFKKEWKFHTQELNTTMHYVKSDEKVFTINEQEEHIFYFPPTSSRDLLKDIRYPSNFDINFIDKNTIKLTALKSVGKRQTLMIGNHTIIIDIQEATKTF